MSKDSPQKRQVRWGTSVGRGIADPITVLLQIAGVLVNPTNVRLSFHARAVNSEILLPSL